MVYLPGTQHTLNIFEPRYMISFEHIIIVMSNSSVVATSAETHLIGSVGSRPQSYYAKMQFNKYMHVVIL